MSKSQNVRAQFVWAAALVALLGCGLVAADFDAYNTEGLADLLQRMEYSDQYGNGNDYDQKLMGDYEDYHYNENVPQDVADLPEDVNADEDLSVMEPEASMDEAEAFRDFVARNEEQKSHGSPTAHAGTTKASVPKNSGAVLPAYCDPPNPCPLGYTEKDGCIEDFENSSEFSRTYQGKQNCLCDSEHMFNCPIEPEQVQQQPQPAAAQRMNSAFLAGMPNPADLDANNPFLAGEKLHIAAKKGLGF